MRPPGESHGVQAARVKGPDGHPDRPAAALDPDRRHAPVSPAASGASGWTARPRTTLIPSESFTTRQLRRLHVTRLRDRWLRRTARPVGHLHRLCYRN
jgi:hypothetical protein